MTAAGGIGAATERPFVELHDVEKRFGDHVVLKGIDLEVAEHEVVCLIGASGSGKSTLLRCINGLEPIQQGEVRVDGRLVIQHDAALNVLRRHVGIVFQSYNLFPHMTVLDNVTLAPRKVLGLSKAEALPARRAAAHPHRHVGEARVVPRHALGRAAAARRDRARAGDAAER